MAGIVEFLFGHTADVWTQGNFALQAPLGRFTIAVGVALLTLAVLILYRQTTAPAPPRLKQS